MAAGHCCCTAKLYLASMIKWCLAWLQAAKAAQEQLQQQPVAQAPAAVTTPKLLQRRPATQVHGIASSAEHAGNVPNLT